MENSRNGSPIHQRGEPFLFLMTTAQGTGVRRTQQTFPNLAAGRMRPPRAGGKTVTIVFQTLPHRNPTKNSSFTDLCCIFALSKEEHTPIMGSWSETQEKKKEGKEKEKIRREKLAGYFYDLSKLIFAALVLGSITPLFSHHEESVNWSAILLGSFSTYLFANFANKILSQ